MALVDLGFSLQCEELPGDVAVLLREADRRIERFTTDRLDRPLAGFVPSDFVMSYHALRDLEERRLAPGNLFCEWGSGFGVVACLASLLGFHAYGIEIQESLVDEAQSLADDFGLPVQFVHGSFIPPGGEDYAVTSEEFNWLETAGSAAHDDLGLDTDDFDVIFAYPWPGEEEVIDGIFDHFAATGAVLITYHGLNDARMRRKVRKRARRRG